MREERGRRTGNEGRGRGKGGGEEREKRGERGE